MADTEMQLNKAKARKTARGAVFYIFLAVLVIVWMVPVTFCLFTAVKSNSDFFGRAVFELPSSIEWRNFSDAWKRVDHYFYNDLLVSFVKVPLGILVEALAAFALTRLRLRSATKIFVFFLIGMMIPMQCTLIPLNIMMSKLGLINTYGGLFIAYIGFGIPFGILVLRGFMRSIPLEIDEAARIDGCSNWQIFWRVVVPVTKPAIATLMILDFLSTWNEFLISSILIMDDSLRTVPTGLASFFGENGANYPLLCAAIIITIIPIVLVYLVFQRNFVEGVSGAVKG